MTVVITTNNIVGKNCSAKTTSPLFFISAHKAAEMETATIPLGAYDPISIRSLMLIELLIVDNNIAIGLKIKKWVTYHGVGINVSTDLSLFSLIRPCGLDVQMTSISQVRNATVSMEDVKNKFVELHVLMLPLISFIIPSSYPSLFASMLARIQFNLLKVLY